MPRMSGNDAKPRWSLPYSTPTPASPRRRRDVRIARICAYALLFCVAVTVIWQFQHLTMENYRKADAFDREHPGLTLHEAAQLGRPKEHKGAIGRWRRAVNLYWRGENIYVMPPDPGDEAAVRQILESLPEGDEAFDVAWLHPNMPFVVILLTPFTSLPVGAMALVFSIVKLCAFVAAVLLAVSVANDDKRRMPDWVLCLALLWSLLLVVADFQHGNTNVFVLFAVVLHLWLYRRGKDAGAGAALALAVCLKVTPGLFVAYWLYQRNWRLLAGAAVALVVFVVAVPLAASVGICDFDPAAGAEHYALTTWTWFDTMIVRNTARQTWFPDHSNQSLSGMVCRFFLSGDDGDVFWRVDDDPYHSIKRDVRITILALPDWGARGVLWAGRLVVLGAIVWAVGWRKLPRDDGRRALHYGLIVIAMALLSQRTWDHHCGVLLIAHVAIWQAIAFGRFSRRLRAWSIAGMIAAGMLVWLSGTQTLEIFARLFGATKHTDSYWSDVVKAYGPTFWHFVLVGVVAVTLSAALRNSEPAYAGTRRKLFAEQQD